MMWGEFKKIVEDFGIEDAYEIEYIDVAGGMKLHIDIRKPLVLGVPANKFSIDATSGGKHTCSRR